MQEALAAEVLDMLNEGSQAGAPGWEERSCGHDKYIYLLQLDSQSKLEGMSKKKAALLQSLQREYQHLAGSLADLGYISQGSVVDRSRLRHPRSGYQWTRKVAQKTVTVALSQEQFKAVAKAIENRRRLARTLTKMENLSRRILFSSLPDTHRRKRLNAKALLTT